jgi:hypothetical protein
LRDALQVTSREKGPGARFLLDFGEELPRLRQVRRRIGCRARLLQRLGETVVGVCAMSG